VDGPVSNQTNIGLGDKLRGTRMTEALLMEAADGYKVVFALAELILRSPRAK